MIASEIEHLIKALSKLPGLGQRSARRAVLHMIKNKETTLNPLINLMQEVSENVKTCPVCGNICLDDESCDICKDMKRHNNVICVVQDVADLWAMERSSVFRGQYHVLGGVLSALDGIGPEDLSIASLVDRASVNNVNEIILALPATVDGQTTGHYLADRLEPHSIKVSGLAQGMPIGGELDYMDDGTILAALNARRAV
ncbi:MAG: recombination protein RecR [Alphaproteobacteria bacterium]|nr:recombination protein RecR [Alphaproteobacteria bacterium]